MMNKKKKAIAFVIVLFLLVALEIVYIFSELYNENDINNVDEVTDAIKFKQEYENINGSKNDEGTLYRVLNISEDNPFIYSNEEDIIKRIENKETFVVYFGFSTCPWCRSVIPSLIDSAKYKHIDKIYYVDIQNIRDKYELDKDNKAVKTVEGTEGYYKLLEKLSNVLDDYQPLTYKTKKNKTKSVAINEKRIYAPNVIVVKNGNAVNLETGITKSLTDPYMELTDDIKCEIKDAFDCLLELLEEKKDTCELNAPAC